MRGAIPICAGILCASTPAQTPDTAMFVDLRPTFFTGADGETSVTMYDRMGRHSLVGIRFRFESGLQGLATQRLQRIDDNGGDPDSLNEFYLENRGTWRLGKQYLPFGQQSLLRESVFGARYNQDVDFLLATVSIVAFSGGDGRPEGVLVRVAGNFGVSVEVGEHIAVSGTALTAIRRPEDAPGQGRGYGLAVGFDVDSSLGNALLEFEWVSLREPETPLDRSLDVSDVVITLPVSDLEHELALGWARNWTSSENFFRLFASLKQSGSVSWEPFIRFENLGFKDFGLTLRVQI